MARSGRRSSVALVMLLGEEGRSFPPGRGEGGDEEAGGRGVGGASEDELRGLFPAGRGLFRGAAEENVVF